MKYHHAMADKKTVKRPAYSGTTAGSQLEQTVAERTRVRHSQVGAVRHQQLDDARVVREDIDRPRLDFAEYPLVEIFNGIRRVEC